jgi:hypothetical protein
LWRSTGTLGQVNNAIDDGLTTTGVGFNAKVTESSRDYVRRNRLIEDLDGDVAVVELTTDAASAVEDIALYAYGDPRTSAAARERITKLQYRLLR